MPRPYIFRAAFLVFFFVVFFLAAFFVAFFFAMAHPHKNPRNTTHSRHVWRLYA